MASGSPFERGQRLACGRFEVALLVEHVVERQQHLLLQKADLAAREQRGNIATRACLRSESPYDWQRAVPQRIAGPLAVSAAISSSASPARARNDYFSSRSAGGYPQTQSSGNTARSAP